MKITQKLAEKIPKNIGEYWVLDEMKPYLFFLEQGALLRKLSRMGVL